MEVEVISLVGFKLLSRFFISINTRLAIAITLDPTSSFGTVVCAWLKVAARPLQKVSHTAKPNALQDCWELKQGRKPCQT